MRDMGKVMAEKVKSLIKTVQQRVNQKSIDVSLPQGSVGQQPASGPQGMQSGIPGFAPPLAAEMQRMQSIRSGGMAIPPPVRSMRGSPMPYATGPHAAALQQQMAVFGEFAAMTMQYPGVGYGGIPTPLDTGFEGTESMTDELLNDEAQVMMEMQVQEHLQMVFMQEMNRK